MPTIPIIGPDYSIGSPIKGDQKLVNWYLESMPYESEEVRYIMRPTPGLRDCLNSAFSVPIRGLVEHRGIVYIASEDDLRQYDPVTENATAVEIAFFNSAAGEMKMIGGGDYLFMIDSSNGYIYDTVNGTATQINDPDFPSSPVSIAYQDGYFLVVGEDQDVFQYSRVEDPLSWEALDTAAAKAKPDYIEFIISDQQQVYAFGTNTIQPFQNTGDADNAWVAQPGVVITRGTSHPDTVQAVDNTLVWLAKDKRGNNLVVRLDGFTPKAISTPAVARSISQMTTTSDAFAFVHSEGAHEFYVLSFPTEKKTFVYDFLEQMWHQRESIVSGTTTCHRMRDSVYVSGRTIGRDLFTGNLLEYKEDLYTEVGERVLRIRETPPLNVENKKLTIHMLDIQFQPGAALTTGQGSDPVAMLEVANDGVTFGPTYYGSIGQLGDHADRVSWYKVGHGRNIVFRLTISDPIDATVLSGVANLTVGDR